MNFNKLIEDVKRLKKETDKLYIYGAGFYGKDVYRALDNNGIKVDGFLVTKENSNKEVLGLPLIEAKSVIEKNIGIVIGLSDTYVGEVINYLKINGMDMSHVINGGKYITDTGGREDLRDSKVLEVSTIMGCSVNCKYCPQDVLLKKYYEHDKKRQRIMTIENFEITLKHTPEDCIIDFSGMTEPFNNPDCLEMIRMACDAGRKVYLFTTLAEVDETIVDELIKLPVYYMTLHVADRCGYAYIPTTEIYYRNVQKVLSAKKIDGRPFVDFLNAQTDPDEKIVEIVRDKYEIMCSVQNRAGNVKDDDAQHRDKVIAPGTKIKCCFCGDDLSNSVVLPDGTLLICNMDYGMQHVLGNLYEEDYDTVRSKGELQRVLKEMDRGTDMNLLCRSCLLAREEH
ncbi:MAG: hypothetical protein HFI91_02440 [Lachnospiraceae bacterium]|nr:hypothetical protein [Lachnospiraceae bacterium]